MNKEVSEQALRFIKANKKLLIDTFANEAMYQPAPVPATIFMAGSPGAGKTEFSKNLLTIVNKKIVRIDADEIREIIPGYTGANSADVQAAAAVGVEKLHDYVLHKKIDAIMDGTFANYAVACKNVQRSVDKQRNIAIFYIYQEPAIAWEFTQKRERLEGRHIPKDVFIRAFFDAKDNVSKIKAMFSDKVVVHLVMKNYDNTNDVEQTQFNVTDIDTHLKTNYTVQTLQSMLS